MTRQAQQKHSLFNTKQQVCVYRIPFGYFSYKYLKLSIIVTILVTGLETLFDTLINCTVKFLPIRFDVTIIGTIVMSNLIGQL